jgi:hypothetical protein
MIKVDLSWLFVPPLVFEALQLIGNASTPGADLVGVLGVFATIVSGCVEYIWRFGVSTFGLQPFMISRSSIFRNSIRRIDLGHDPVAVIAFFRSMEHKRPAYW